MCVIILKEGKQCPTKAILRNAAVLNPDGLSVMWLDDGKLVRTESLNHPLLKVLEDTDRPYVAHFRYATRGKKTKVNTHPYPIFDSFEQEYVTGWLFQNGTVESMGDEVVADTEEMAGILSMLPRSKWRPLLEMSESRWLIVNEEDTSVQVYNEDMWVEQNGVLYSKRNVLLTESVAVYGTLKRGRGNYTRHLYKTGSQFSGSGKTRTRYPLVVNGLPYLYDQPNKGHQVEVDVFRVSSKTLEMLDALEGHPDWYKRRQEWIEMESGAKRMCWVYFMQGNPDDGVEFVTCY